MNSSTTIKLLPIADAMKKSQLSIDHLLMHAISGKIRCCIPVQKRVSVYAICQSIYATKDSTKENYGKFILPQKLTGFPKSSYLEAPDPKEKVQWLNLLPEDCRALIPSSCHQVSVFQSGWTISKDQEGFKLKIVTPDEYDPNKSHHIDELTSQMINQPGLVEIQNIRNRFRKIETNFEKLYQWQFITHSSGYRNIRGTQDSSRNISHAPLKVRKHELLIPDIDLRILLEETNKSLAAAFSDENFVILHKNASAQLQELKKASDRFWRNITPGNAKSYPTDVKVRTYLRGIKDINGDRLFNDDLAEKAAEIIKPEFANVTYPPEATRQYTLYRSPSFKVLVKASEKFWENADLTDAYTCHTSPEIEYFIKSSGLFKEGLEAAGAQIIRPKGAPKRPRFPFTKPENS